MFARDCVRAVFYALFWLIHINKCLMSNVAQRGVLEYVFPLTYFVLTQDNEEYVCYRVCILCRQQLSGSSIR